MKRPFKFCLLASCLAAALAPVSVRANFVFPNTYRSEVTIRLNSKPDEEAPERFKSSNEYSKYFEIDLEAPLPDLQELQVRYEQPDRHYEKLFGHRSDLGNVFDQAVRETISYYGMNEKRLKSEEEDHLLELLAVLPKEFYPYIGPMLHEVPNMSPKILNMPGIKETKNKFPERIAPQLKHVENLELMSPRFYFLLMPEMWPGNESMIEYPQPKPAREARPVAEPLDPRVMAAVNRLVPKERFYPNAPKPKGFDYSKLRTTNATKNSPLTSADVQAFARSLPLLADLGNDLDFVFSLYVAGMYLDMYEEEQGNLITLGNLKDVVNPCQRMVQKVRLVGQELELLKRVSKEGFNVNSWAYTCDKTLKAFRMATMSGSVAASLVQHKKGVYNAYMLGNEETVRQQRFMQQAFIEEYNATLGDMMEARKNKKEIYDALESIGFSILGMPLDI